MLRPGFAAFFARGLAVGFAEGFAAGFAVGFADGFATDFASGSSPSLKRPAPQRPNAPLRWDAAALAGGGDDDSAERRVHPRRGRGHTPFDDRYRMAMVAALEGLPFAARTPYSATAMLEIRRGTQ